MKSVLAVLILSCTIEAYNPNQNRKSKIPCSRHKTPCKSVTKTIIETNKAPLFNIPISQAVLVGNTTLHLSGQLGIDPVTLQLVPGGIIPETRQIFRNIAAVIEAAGGRLKDVVKCDVFLTNLEELTAFDKVYTKSPNNEDTFTYSNMHVYIPTTFFPQDFPARAVIQVVAVPFGGQVEVKTVAFINRC